MFKFLPFFYYTDEAEHIPHRDTPWYQRLYNCIFGFDDSEKAQVRSQCLSCVDYWYKRTKSHTHKRRNFIHLQDFIGIQEIFMWIL